MATVLLFLSSFYLQISLYKYTGYKNIQRWAKYSHLGISNTKIQILLLRYLKYQIHSHEYLKYKIQNSILKY